jgi:hypothetical protein
MIIIFKSKLELTNDPDSDNLWVLVQDFEVDIDGVRLTVPRGFETDLASTPRFLWPIFPPTGRWDEAAAIHDYLYHVAARNQRQYADEILYNAMIACNVPLWRAWSMWAAVRLFGGKYYGIS